ncbi:MAG: hypothetical protein HY864_18590 [Chloroflexi bacterium]|nr:hypothetical protein [Chloroflexota bacterium]
MRKIIALFFVLAVIVPTAVAFAKGDFAYIAIKGPGITGELNVTNPSLTEDFFVFADFSKGSIEAPLDPGQGYQVTRVYVDGTDVLPFDQLHYYPYTGYVYYDGLVNGSSEYVGKWYLANDAASAPFRAALSEKARLSWYTFGVLAIILVIVFIAYHSKPKAAAA